MDASTDLSQYEFFSRDDVEEEDDCDDEGTAVAPSRAFTLSATRMSETVYPESRTQG